MSETICSCGGESAEWPYWLTSMELQVTAQSHTYKYSCILIYIGCIFFIRLDSRQKRGEQTRAQLLHIRIWERILDHSM